MKYTGKMKDLINQMHNAQAELAKMQAKCVEKLVQEGYEVQVYMDEIIVARKDNNS